MTSVLFSIIPSSLPECKASGALFPPKDGFFREKRVDIRRLPCYNEDRIPIKGGLSMDESVLFFSLICAPLGGAKPDLSGVSDQALSRILALARRQDLGHLMARTLIGGGMDEGHPLYPALVRQEQLALLRATRRDYAIEQISRLLEEEGIDFMPLKGALIRHLYPAPHLRTSCDLDILVREDRVLDAARAIEERLSYRPEGGRQYHDYTLLSPDGVRLELHFSLAENDPRMDGVLSRVREHARPAAEGAHLHLPSDAFLILHHTAHAAHHLLMGGCGMRPLIDLHLMHRALMPDEGELDTLLAKSSLTDFHRHALSLAACWFEGRPSEGAEKELERFLLANHLYGSDGSRVAISRSRRSHAAHLKSRLLLPYEELSVRYPSLRGRRPLTPMYQLLRILSLPLSGRLSRSVRELRLSSRMDRERQEQIDGMLRELGL